jgi:hypothetical protein
MKKRRQFIRLMMGFFAGMGFYLSPLATGVRLVWAKAKKVLLPKGTRMRDLIGRYSVRQGVSGLSGKRPGLAQKTRIPATAGGGRVLRRRLG